ncbi:hypothetical protein BHM03_00009399 [Ensete ventricosum]|nr:hypothetical protein BHM03_00009399 [Ensete ventricosum]
MYVHKPKDTDKHEHFIKHLVYILTVTAWRGSRVAQRPDPSTSDADVIVDLTAKLEQISSSGVMVGADAKALQALEAMKSHHDFDSTIRPGQWSYHSYPEGFSISIDALEAGLGFPLHPVIGDFGVGGAPSNNKGWKAWFLFISRRWGWDFGVKWSAHSVSNVPPNLSDEKTNLIGRLKGIMSISRAIRSLTEEWLVEVGLSPASHGEDPVDQRKKDRCKSPNKADRVATKGKGTVDISEEPPALRRKSKSVRELYSASIGVDGRDYHAIRMCNLPERAPEAPLDVDLRPLTHGMIVWQDGEGRLRPSISEAHCAGYKCPASQSRE